MTRLGRIIIGAVVAAIVLLTVIIVSVSNILFRRQCDDILESRSESTMKVIINDMERLESEPADIFEKMKLNQDFIPAISSGDGKRELRKIFLHISTVLTAPRSGTAEKIRR